MVTIDKPDEMFDADFVIKQGDVEPPITAELNTPAGSDEDLSGDAVTFQMWLPGSDSRKVDETATVDDAQTGLVSYNWSSGDTDTAGYYNAQWVVDNSDDSTVDETFPNEGFLTVRVMPNQ